VSRRRIALIVCAVLGYLAVAVVVAAVQARRTCPPVGSPPGWARSEAKWNRDGVVAAAIAWPISAPFILLAEVRDRANPSLAACPDHPKGGA
jgi:hypothetical protein